MSFSIGSILTPTPVQTQNNQPPSADEPLPAQTQTQQQSDPAPARESDPVAPTSSTKNEAEAGEARPPETQSAAASGATQSFARAQTGSDATSESVVELKLQEAGAQKDVADARRDAEAARQAYIEQAAIDRVQALPADSVSRLFETPEVEKTQQSDSGTSLADVGEVEEAAAEDPFAKAD